MTPFEQAVAALGTTPEQVSNTLREKGIKGYRRQASSCPIAKYLNACGFPLITVATHASCYPSKDAGDPNETISLPPGVRDWIFSFDRGEYPEFYHSMGSDDPILDDLKPWE